jgi:uncharacterized protein (TIGR04255 family)
MSGRAKTSASREPQTSGSVLSRPPLQEAIFEVRWPHRLDDENQPLSGSTEFKILLARFFDRVTASEEFADTEPLQPASLPDGVASGSVQYRWRSTLNPGVLLQIGPGVLTVNHVKPTEYHWELFFGQICWAIKSLRESHPKRAELSPKSVAFRYINSVRFDASAEETYTFLREKLHIDFRSPIGVLPPQVGTRAQNLKTQTSFMCNSPCGRVTLVFANVYVPEERILWQIVFDALGEDIPSLSEGVETWLMSAHQVIDTTFRNMIRGEMEAMFA